MKETTVALDWTPGERQTSTASFLDAIHSPNWSRLWPFREVWLEPVVNNTSYAIVVKLL